MKKLLLAVSLLSLISTQTAIANDAELVSGQALTLGGVSTAVGGGVYFITVAGGGLAITGGVALIIVGGAVSIYGADITLSKTMGKVEDIQAQLDMYNATGVMPETLKSSLLTLKQVVVETSNVEVDLESLAQEVELALSK
jgi:hypothetical protein